MCRGKQMRKVARYYAHILKIQVLQLARLCPLATMKREQRSWTGSFVHRVVSLSFSWMAVVRNSAKKWLPELYSSLCRPSCGTCLRAYNV